MPPPAVSVILPTYNPAPALLQAAVASVLSQSTHLELIVVDDGSLSPVTEALPGDARIRVHRQENGGVASARNAGLALAQGRFVAFLDDDDTWLPGSLARRVEVLERQPPEVVGVLSAPVGPRHDGGEGPWFAMDDLPIGQDRRLGRAEYCALQSAHGYFLWQGSLFHKYALDAAGGFDVDLFAAEDQDVLLRILHRQDLAFLQEPTFRRMKPSMTANPQNAGRIAWSSYRMVRKHVADVSQHWHAKDARAFWAHHDASVRRCLKLAHHAPASESAATLRAQFSKPSARNLRSYFTSLISDYLRNGVLMAILLIGN